MGLKKSVIGKVGMVMPIYATKRSQFLAKRALALMGKDVLALPPPKSLKAKELHLELCISSGKGTKISE